MNARPWLVLTALFGFIALGAQARPTAPPQPAGADLAKPAEVQAAAAPGSIQNMPYAALIPAADSRAPMAVTDIYDGVSGNVTALSHLLRDRIEARLRALNAQLVARLDIALVEEDNQIHRAPSQGAAPEASTEARVLVTGRYYLQLAASAAGKDRLELHLKAVRASDYRILGAIRRLEPLPPGWQRQVNKVWYNAYQGAMETVANEGGRGPRLQARLDQADGCYPAGSQAWLSIDTEADSHLYLFALAADGSVTLLRPNRLIEDRPLAQGQVEFPPPELRESGQLQLILYPLNNRDTQESFKLVASDQPLDFSFLPQPENALFTGARGGDLKRLLGVLDQAEGWSEHSLNYWVGPRCR